MREYLPSRSIDNPPCSCLLKSHIISRKNRFMYQVLEFAERGQPVKNLSFSSGFTNAYWGNLIYPLSLEGPFGVECGSVLWVWCVVKALLCFFASGSGSLPAGDRNPDSSRRSADGLSGDRAGRRSSPSKTVHYITFPKSWYQMQMIMQMISTASSPLWTLSEGQLKPLTGVTCSVTWLFVSMLVKLEGDAHLAKPWIRAYPCEKGTLCLTKELLKICRVWMNTVLAVYLVRKHATLVSFSQSIVLLMEKCSFTFEREVNEDTCVVEIPHSIKSVSNSHQRPEQTSNMEHNNRSLEPFTQNTFSCSKTAEQTARVESVYLSVHLSICLYVVLSIHLSIHLYRIICQSVIISIYFLSVCLSVVILIFQSICLSFYFSYYCSFYCSIWTLGIFLLISQQLSN